MKLESNPGDPTAALTLAAMKRANVDASVVPVVDWTIVGLPSEDHPSIQELNSLYSSLHTRHPQKLFHCCGVDPRHPQARQILESALAEPGCCGVKLYPAAGWIADDPSHLWIWQLLAERGVPVVVHTGSIGGDPLNTPLSRPAALASILAAFPTITLVFAHAGYEAWWQEALDIAHGWQSTYLELSLWFELAERDYSTFRSRVGTMVDRLGAHRILWGSDLLRGPEDPDGARLQRCVELFAGLGEPYAGAPAILSGEQTEQIMGLVANEIFGLDL